MTWILVFYVSSGFGTASTGGPAVIDKFSSGAACVIAGEELKKELGGKLDWFKCVRLDKS